MTKRLLILGLSMAAAAAAQASTSFHVPVSISSSTSATDLFPVSNLIQGPGSGFDANDPHAKLLGGPDGNWVTAAPGGFPADYIAVAGPPVLTIDLGVDLPLYEISAWGYANSNANGVSSFSLRFATAAEGLAGFGGSIAFNPTYFAINDETARQSFPFGETIQARYVEMTLLDNHFVAPGDGSGGEIPGGDRVGLGEVAFAVVPEPSATFLALSSLGFLLLRRRARRC